MTKRKRKVNNDYSFIMKIITVILIVYCISLIYPMIWALITSLKGTLDYLSNPIGLPKKLEFENYLTAYKYFYVTVDVDGSTKYIYLEQMIFNSLLYSVGGAFFSTFTAAVTAYATSRFKLSSAKSFIGL